MRCKGAKVWRKEIVDKRFRNIHEEVGIRKTVRSIKSTGRKRNAND